MRNYRRIGATNATYLVGLSSGQSQVEKLTGIIKDSIIIKSKNRLKLIENINIVAKDDING